MNTHTKKKEEMVTKESYLRLAADFDNARKDHAQVLERMAKFAALPIVTQVLDALDTLEEALVHAPDSVRQEASWFSGVEQTQKQFIDMLERVGAERIETTEQPFDPATMEAVQMVPGGEQNTVQAEQRAGWRMHGRVIRPARVVVFQ